MGSLFGSSKVFSIYNCSTTSLDSLRVLRTYESLFYKRSVLFEHCSETYVDRTGVEMFPTYEISVLAQAKSCHSQSGFFNISGILTYLHNRVAPLYPSIHIFPQARNIRYGFVVSPRHREVLPVVVIRKSLNDRCRLDSGNVVHAALTPSTELRFRLSSGPVLPYSPIDTRNVSLSLANSGLIRLHAKKVQ